jgi:hypothetical protein
VGLVERVEFGHVRRSAQPSLADLEHGRFEGEAVLVNG